jgi:hypothetical protein
MNPTDFRKRTAIEHFIAADEIDVHTRREFIKLVHILLDWSEEFDLEVLSQPELAHLRKDWVLPGRSSEEAL